MYRFYFIYIRNRQARIVGWFVLLDPHRNYQYVIDSTSIRCSWCSLSLSVHCNLWLILTTILLCYCYTFNCILSHLIVIILIRNCIYYYRRWIKVHSMWLRQYVVTVRFIEYINSSCMHVYWYLCTDPVGKTG